MSHSGIALGLLFAFLWCQVKCSDNLNDLNAGLSRQKILSEILGIADTSSKDGKAKYDSSIAPDFEFNLSWINVLSSRKQDLCIQKNPAESIHSLHVQEKTDIETNDTTTLVEIKILIQNIYSVTETSMDYSLDIFLRQKWQDPRLNYSRMYEKEHLELDSKMMDRVWVPDTFFPNEKKASVHTVTVPNKMMHVYKNGTVLYSIRLSLTLSCSMQLQKYPMDVQRCPIILSSYAYTKENVEYKWEGDNPLKLNYVEMPQFDASIDSELQNACKNYGENDFACIKGFINLRRKVGYYIVQVFVPSILIVVLSWVSFWVDHDAVPARISLGVLTVLTMTTQSSGARQSLPQVSYVKAIDVWMSTCLMFVFAALIEYSYVNVVARRRHKSGPEKPIELQPLTTDSNRSTNAGGQSTKVAANDPKNASNIAARRIDKLSRWIFPVAFLIFNVIFWMYYMI